MSCRCTDKSNCRKDIRTIEDILSILLDSERTNRDVFEEHNNLISGSKETFTTINMDSLNKVELELNQKVNEKIPSLIIKCKEKIKSLESEYRRLEHEDDIYHENQRKKNTIN